MASGIVRSHSTIFFEVHVKTKIVLWNVLRTSLVLIIVGLMIIPFYTKLLENSLKRDQILRDASTWCKYKIHLDSTSAEDTYFYINYQNRIHDMEHENDIWSGGKSYQEREMSLGYHAGFWQKVPTEMKERFFSHESSFSDSLDERLKLVKYKYYTEFKGELTQYLKNPVKWEKDYKIKIQKGSIISSAGYDWTGMFKSEELPNLFSNEKSVKLIYSVRNDTHL